ncbi:MULTISPECIES: type III glutamate--ammonia ligase [unclassified Synechococcus]|uniref:type III glutamate--ammonia ligase n=1 Tax=unclassified Synechococcus TaxID=2626047 RepID=UPI0021A28F14|nr:MULTISPECIES: type III glutamate--ammonia ligase [unclassified Synechococcus]MCT0212225.1 type III glutamate--ammonia ligase [Synechococcus sp. CS-1326]MCT0234362.1 type III glutamate--ammonia ligase [Synechococcus sp. CS-1327]
MTASDPTAQDPAALARFAASHGIRHFLFSFADLFGVQRAKLVPTCAVESVARAGAGFAGFAAWFAMTPADPDVLGLPDPASLMVLPWQRELAWVATDLVVEGQPLEQSPRWVLKRQLERAAALGYRFRTGVEAEFFLLTPDREAIADHADTQSKPCYDQLALMRQLPLIGGLLEAMEELGWGPYQADHEDANGQFEINWTFADALVTADRHAFFRVMASAMAEEQGAQVSFAPKPFAALTGNGAHLHHSLWDADGRNLFHDPLGEQGLSELAYAFLAGVLEHAAALCALTNPTAESYRRLAGRAPSSGATWSPGWISYGGNNRTHMVRIPDDQRLELRLADGDANPYLLPAAVLAAGLDGIERGLDPGPRSDANTYTDPPTGAAARPLPASPHEALEAFANDRILRDSLGEPFCQAYERLRRQQLTG